MFIFDVYIFNSIRRNLASLHPVSLAEISRYMCLGFCAVYISNGYLMFIFDVYIWNPIRRNLASLHPVSLANIKE